jgi:hypothetical protein
VVASATIAEKQPEEQADRTCSFVEKSWQKTLVEAQASVVHSSQKSRSRTTLLQRVGDQIVWLGYSCKLEMLAEERILLTNERRKLVLEKIL